MKFSLPFFRRKSAETPRNALVEQPPEPPAEENRSRWDLAAEQLASMNAAKAEAVAPAPIPWQALPAEPEPTKAAPVAVPPPAPVAVAAPTAPLGMTREDVVAAFHLFLRRDPESEAVIEPYLGRERERLLGAFLTSAEFLQWPEHLRLIVEVAQAIELRQLVPPPREGVPALSAQDLEAARRILQPSAPAQDTEPSLEGQPVDWALARLMCSDAFQRNPFNAKLVTGLAREIAGQLKPQTDPGAGARLG
ncbi:hypothetical protein [Malikia sp.]|uniref:hypothetical protein n=1 Tax=Malikia sp. TaxID=2070706 RepID=UPI00263430AE|nr:hypothetical protein [Malikia sp.]MDD2728264.1 hypothetical protein [Malikia sp.]